MTRKGRGKKAQPSEIKTWEGYRNDDIMYEKCAALKEEQ